MSRRRTLAVGLLLLLAAAWGAQALVIPAKAVAAQWLMLAAWQGSRDDRGPQRPWPWADTYPVARLHQPRLGIDQLVLQGASGRVLAFGPGWIPGTARPGDVGNLVISGHRDTHFKWLPELRDGDRLVLELPDGRVRHYRVADRRVHFESDAWLLAATMGDGLRLVTCYPFAGVDPGTDRRYVVTAYPVSDGTGAVPP